MSNFAGSTLVVSHDRWFLDRIATHILAFEGDSQVGRPRGRKAVHAARDAGLPGRGASEQWRGPPPVRCALAPGAAGARHAAPGRTMLPKLHTTGSASDKTCLRTPPLTPSAIQRAQVTWFEGGWADYEAYQRQKSGGQLMPHRVKFRRLAAV